jgi:hypothetical protein
MFRLRKERELLKVTDDDDSGGEYDKPDLDCIIGASLVDDMGASSAVLERIIGFYRSWHSRRTMHRTVGHSTDIRSVQMASATVEPKV